MGIASLVVNNVVTGYKNYEIKAVDFSLKSGDILGLVGRSGAGKSTLIKTIIGVKKPKSGSVNLLVNGKPVDILRYLGYSPQSDFLYPFLTVKENVFTFAQLYGIPKKQILERMNYFMDRLRLTGSEDKRITQLSGGMRKRVDLMVSLIHNPLLIILDEPFAGLDISLQHFLWDFLKELASQGRIIIVASHFIQSVQKNCTTFALIENGYFYNNDLLISYLIKYKETSLEDFLDKLFSMKVLKVNK